jgi:hypothetical protein
LGAELYADANVYSERDPDSDAVSDPERDSTIDLHQPGI